MAVTALCGPSSFQWSVPRAPPDDRAPLMIGAIFRKDWALLWPLVLLVTLIQIALEWAIYTFGFFGVSPFAREIMGLLTPAWYIGVIALAVAVVHEDTIPGVDQDWLIRPLNRTELLLAKLLFVAVTVCVPMLIVNLADELALGFKVIPSFGDALYKEVYMFVCLLVPATAIASATRNAVELVILVAGLVLLYVVTAESVATPGIARGIRCRTRCSILLAQDVGCTSAVGSGCGFAGGCPIAVECGLHHSNLDGSAHRHLTRSNPGYGR